MTPYVIPFVFFFAFLSSHVKADNMKEANYSISLSMDLIDAVYSGEETAEIREELANIPLETLVSQLHTDALKKAFWINVYNSYVIIFLKEDPNQYENRGAFFSSKKIQIANHSFSFDDIEHGIIRRSKVKLGLGLIPNFFPGSLERKLRVKKVDPRVHFALNCGAKSCPPVRNFVAEKLDEQLDQASVSYLAESLEYDAENEKLELTALMSWFRGDFGGKKGSLKFLKKLELIPADAKPNISFQKYDWSVDLNNFKI